MADAKSTISTLIGQRFGRLTVAEFVEVRKSKKRWKCQCDCGGVTIATTTHLRSGNTKSCGCLAKEAAAQRFRKHGGRRTSEYCIWSHMTGRCHNPANAAYKNYGGRGVFVCDKWRRDFTAFLADVGPRPSLHHSIDRIDNSKGYEPGNVRWATRQTQNRNTRSNRLIEWNGETRTLVEWAEYLGIDYYTMHARLKRGWSVDRAMTEPIHEEKKRP